MLDAYRSPIWGNPAGVKSDQTVTWVYVRGCWMLGERLVWRDDECFWDTVVRERGKGNMRTRFLGIALFLITLIFLSTACAPTNKVAGLSNNNKQTDMSSSAGNKTAQNVGLNDSGSINTASFTDINHGSIVIGHSILNTEDGGQHWSKIADISADVYDIEFISLKFGWLATSDGLLKTEDGGSTWHNIGKPQGKAATRVQFVDEKHGWIDVYHDWLDIEVGNPDYYYLRTTDGGENWTNIKIPDPDKFTRLSYFFISPSQGWLITGGLPGAGQQLKKLYKTLDGGNSWDEISNTSIIPHESDGLPSSGYVSDLYFLNEKYGWLTESRGQLFVTTDGGKDWILVDKHPVKEWFMAKPFFVNLKEGYVLDSLSGSNLFLLMTRDGGLSWKRVYP
jgi:photosystem II stability/assembly factor-like uncharacterized protein